MENSIKRFFFIETFPDPNQKKVNARAELSETKNKNLIC